jgi:hypothetical protein
MQLCGVRLLDKQQSSGAEMDCNIRPPISHVLSPTTSLARRARAAQTALSHLRARYVLNITDGNLDYWLTYHLAHRQHLTFGKHLWDRDGAGMCAFGASPCCLPLSTSLGTCICLGSFCAFPKASQTIPIYSSW